MESINIQIPSLIENIRIIESFIDNVKDLYNIDDDIYGNIMIAVTESVNNAIKHGNKEDKNKNVNLSLHLRENLVKFIIEDQGNGFDFSSPPDPTLPENIDKPGGRGIFLMKNLSDEVHFLNNGRTVELIFYFN
ncbi:ATP-binding protein [Rhodocytophaga rosea]|uniref:ATP-binding protein n=1 Tax=Rhodocytophaga rosea TaxID=2704465 RepID=A0A6C0GJP4_9BACT|nr:ATP-binding protein [Rhodocytophaga rosea]QHT67903.1 ATP-binding protein [Rhodocytophaga rosea]